MKTTNTLKPVLFLLLLATSLTAQFADVPKGHWAYDAVTSGLERGFFNCCFGPCNFHGNKVVNRYQVSVMIKKLLSTIERTTPLTGDQSDRIAALKATLDSMWNNSTDLGTRLDRISRLKHRIDQAADQRVLPVSGQAPSLATMKAVPTRKTQ